jgi:hypothetical protein
VTVERCRRGLSAWNIALHPDAFDDEYVTIALSHLDLWMRRGSEAAEFLLAAPRRAENPNS